MRVTAPRAAGAAVHDGGAEWLVSADCPNCRARLSANVQPGPWTVLAEDPDADGFDARRAAGKLRHETVTTLPTQLWCFRCDRGVNVTVHHGDTA